MRRQLPKPILTGVLIIGLTACLGCGTKNPGADGPGVDAGQSPTEIAQSCLEMCQQGKTAEAIQKYVDLDAIARNVFADEFDQLDQEKKETVRGGLVRLIEAAVANWPLSEAEEASQGELSTSETEDGLTCVSRRVTLSDGDLQESRLFLDQIDGRWRIVDMGNASFSLTTVLALACQQMENPIDETPPKEMSPDEMIKQLLAMAATMGMEVERE